MKKGILLITVYAFILCSFLPIMSSATELSVLVNGKPITFGTSKPYFGTKNVIMAPLDEIAAAIDAIYYTDTQKQQTTFSANNRRVDLKHNSEVAFFYKDKLLNMQTKYLKAETALLNNKLFVPIEEVFEMLGGASRYDSQAQILNLFMGDESKNDEKLLSSEVPMSEDRNFITNKDVMPIGGWIGPPPANIGGIKTEDFATNKYYKDVRDAGLNLIYPRLIGPWGGDYTTNTIKTMDAAAANGVLYMVFDPNIYNQAVNNPQGFTEDWLRQHTAVYRNHPAFAGVQIYDEPGADKFDTFATIKPIYEKVIDPKYYFYVNLFPNVASQQQLTGQQSGASLTYEQYLKQYADKVKNKFISYDFYPFGKTFPKVETAHFENLHYNAKQAKASGVPFWAFIQNMKFADGVRKPIRSEIEWQVNTSLAYGAKGIQYFCYWDYFEGKGWEGSLVNMDGTKNQSYYDVQAINRHIMAIDHVLMNATSKGIMVTNAPKSFYGDSMIPEINKEDIIPSYDVLDRVTSDDIRLMTGCFDYNGKPAYYIVNNTINMNGQATIRLNNNYDIQIIQGATTYNLNAKDYTITLKAGEGALLVVNK